MSPRKYQCAIYMAESADLVRAWREAGDTEKADQLETALRADQHQLYHDGEFADGCDICDREREEYS